MKKIISNFFYRFLDFRFYKLIYIMFLVVIKKKNSSGRIRVQGQKITYNDAFALLGMYNEIIYQELYKFDSSKTDPIIVDIGSNIGISMLYFHKLYPNSNLIGIEADPTIFKILKNNLASNNCQAQLLNKAVWKTENEILSFGSSGADSGSLFSKEKTIKVSSMLLSKILIEHDEIEMLKIDIEGAEKYVIEECKEYLGKVKHIFIEFHSFPNQAQELEKILKTLAGLGYRYKILQARKESQPFIRTKITSLMDLQLNLFFYK